MQLNSSISMKLQALKSSLFGFNCTQHLHASPAFVYKFVLYESILADAISEFEWNAPPEGMFSTTRPTVYEREHDPAHQKDSVSLTAHQTVSFPIVVPV